MPRLKRLEKTDGDPKAQQMMAELDGKKLLLNIFRGMANSPAVLEGYQKLSGALGGAKLDAKTRESIALVVGQENQCEYCLSAHSVIGKNAGLDPQAILEARKGKSAVAKTQGAVTLAKRLVSERGRVTDADVTNARSAGLDDGEIAEVVAVVALNIFTNYFNHMNQTEVDFPKVGLEAR